MAETNKSAVAAWGSLVDDVVHKGLPSTKEQQHKAEMDNIGRELLKGTAEGVYNAWRLLRGGADGYFGTMTDYANGTGVTTASTSRHIAALGEGLGNYHSESDYVNQMREAAQTVTAGTGEPLSRIQETANSRAVGGPADEFSEEVSGYFERMIDSSDLNEAKKNAQMLLDRVGQEEQGIDGLSANMVQQAETITQVADQEKQKFNGFRYDYFNGGAKVGIQDVNSFAASMEALSSQAISDQEVMLRNCSGAKMAVDGLHGKWHEFVTNYFPEK